MRPALLAGYAADVAFADPRRGHPVAGFGTLAAGLESRTWADERARGAWVAAGLVLATALAGRLAGARPTGAAALCWVALGGSSLLREAERVAGSVGDGELDRARHELRALCGRDAAALDADGLARAVCESVAENTSDAVVATLLWGALLGPAGLCAHRAANTLDAMFGHRSPRHERFGWASARLDDLLGWPAARLTVLLVAGLAPLVGGSPRAALRAARRDGPAHPSPNAGPVEAAFAGALGLAFGGPLAYAGRREERPVLGAGNRAPELRDVARTARLSRAVGLAAALLCAGAAR